MFVVAPALAVGVMPTSADISVLPGASASSTFVIANDTDDTSVFDLSLQLVTFAADGTPVFSGPAPSWVALDVSSVSVAPRFAAEVALTASPASNIAVGNYVVAVLVQETPSSSRGIQFATAYSSLAFITVGEVTAPVARCDDASIGQSAGRNVALTVSVSNDGGGILYTEASLEASSMLGDRDLATNAGSAHRVMPGQTRTLSWEAALPWWMFGLVTLSAGGLGCGSMSTVILPSGSLIVVVCGIAGAVLAFLLAWRKRRG